MPLAPLFCASVLSPSSSYTNKTHKQQQHTHNDTQRQKKQQPLFAPFAPPPPPILAGAVDLSKLDAGALRRYRSVHRLEGVVAATAPKEDLARAAARHFASDSVADEGGVLLAFCAALRRRSSSGSGCCTA